MMDFVWDQHNVDHIALHGIAPEEVEQALQNEPFDGEEQFRNGEVRQSHLGITDAGTVLLVITTLRDGKVRPVTAWKASQKERAWFKHHTENKQT